MTDPAGLEHARWDGNVFYGVDWRLRRMSPLERAVAQLYALTEVSPIAVSCAYRSPADQAAIERGGQAHNSRPWDPAAWGPVRASPLMAFGGPVFVGIDPANAEDVGATVFLTVGPDGTIYFDKDPG